MKNSNYIEKIEDFIFMIQYQIKESNIENQIQESILERGSWSDFYLLSEQEDYNKLKKRFGKINEYCIYFLENEMLLSKNEIIRLMKIKNIFEEWKNIFCDKLIHTIFNQLYDIIKHNCSHQYVTDSIDIDPEKSIIIHYCHICYCTHS